MMKKKQQWPPKQLIIKYSKEFSSPSTRALKAAGLAASAAALRKAAEAGIQVAIWKDGAVVKCDPKSLLKND